MVESALHKLHRFDLFNSGMTVKSGMQHFSSAEVHGNMEDLPVTKKGDHIAFFCLAPGYFHKTAPPLFLFVPVLNAEIRVVIKLYAELPAVELDDKAPAVKKWEFSAVWCMSDKKIMVKPHI